MAINRMKTGLLACGLQLLLIAGAAAQEDPYFPDVGSVQIFDKADLSKYGRGPKHPEGWFGRFDYLHWNVSGPESTTIGREGYNPLVYTGVSFVIQPNSMDTTFIESEFTGGNRVEFGFIRDDVGWLSSTFDLQTTHSRTSGSNVGVSFLPQVFGGQTALEGFIDANQDGFDDDLNLNNIYGRDGIDLGTPSGGGYVPPLDGIPDQGAPTDLGDLVTFPVFFDDLIAVNRTHVWGTEVMRVWRVCKSPNGVFEIFGGVRYLNYEDEFDVTTFGENFLDTGDDDDGDGLITGPVQPTDNPLAEASWNTRTDNDLVGPQLGYRITRRRGNRMTFSTEGRFMAAANFQTFRQQGILASYSTGGLTNVPVNLYGQRFDVGGNDVEFAPLAEIRFEASYQVFRSAAINFGYTALWADNIARASNHVDYVVPGMGINFGRETEDILLHGFNVGFQVNR